MQRRIPWPQRLGVAVSTLNFCAWVAPDTNWPRHDRATQRAVHKLDRHAAAPLSTIGQSVFIRSADPGRSTGAVAVRYACLCQRFGSPLVARMLVTDVRSQASARSYGEPVPSVDT